LNPLPGQEAETAEQLEEDQEEPVGKLSPASETA
jgi:hypothetical protein